MLENNSTSPEIEDYYYGDALGTPLSLMDYACIIAFVGASIGASYYVYKYYKIHAPIADASLEEN